MQHLTLPIKKKWFDMILSGEKKEEYRELNKHYHSRLQRYNCLQHMGSEEEFHKPEFWILFRNGYSRTSPSFRALCTVGIGEGRAEWGAEPGKEYYVIHIHEIDEVKTWKK